MLFGLLPGGRFALLILFISCKLLFSLLLPHAISLTPSFPSLLIPPSRSTSFLRRNLIPLPCLPTSQ